MEVSIWVIMTASGRFIKWAKGPRGSLNLVGSIAEATLLDEREVSSPDVRDELVKTYGGYVLMPVSPSEPTKIDLKRLSRSLPNDVALPARTNIGKLRR